MNESEEFLPKRELEEFILVEVVRPQLEYHINRGVPVQAVIKFIAGKQIKNIKPMGALKRPVIIELELRLTKDRVGNILFNLKTELIDSEDAGHGDALIWNFSETIKRDQKGYYLSYHIMKHLS